MQVIPEKVAPRRVHVGTSRDVPGRGMVGRRGTGPLFDLQV